MNLDYLPWETWKRDHTRNPFMPRFVLSPLVLRMMFGIWAEHVTRKAEKQDLDDDGFEDLLK